MTMCTFCVLRVFVTVLVVWSGLGANALDGWSVSNRIVTTKYGRLRGRIVRPTSRYGVALSEVEVFLGVPYVSPPIGTLRFMPPVNSPHWDDIREADHFMPVCPQNLPGFLKETKTPFHNASRNSNSGTADSSTKRSDQSAYMPQGRVEYLKKLVPLLSNQSEDCLYLNLYTPYPKSVRSRKLPVVLIIHGESFEWSSGNIYDGTVLSSYGEMVVITVNYRLGILGFLPAMDGASRANNGLLDLVAALHWIENNVEAFGGNKDNVTLMGHGHGAAIVNLLMISPMARPLFHRGILMSGSALSPYAVARDAHHYAREVGLHLKCPMGNEAAALGDCLRHRPFRELLDVSLEIPDHLSAFGPIIDGSVIPNEPLHEMASPSSGYADFDLLFGVVKFESYFHFSTHEEKHGFEVDRRDRLIRTLVRNLYSYHQQEIFLTIVNEYTDWTRSVQHPVSVLEETAEALSDALVVAPLVEAGTLHARAVNYKKTGKKTSFYLFSYHTEESSYSQKTGAVHGEDFPYVLGVPLLGANTLLYGNYTRSEAAVAETIISHWSNFVKTGSPNITELEGEKSKSRVEKIAWPEYDPVHQKYFILSVKSKVRDHYHAHRLSIWNRLIPQLHRAGLGDVPRRHHLLEKFDDTESYSGIVRDATLPIPSMETPSPDPPVPPTSAMPYGRHRNNSIVYKTQMTQVNPLSNFSHIQGMSSLVNGGYSTALGATIAVGCSLLVLNLLVFIGVCYQRDKGRSPETNNKKRPFQPLHLNSNESVRATTATLLADASKEELSMMETNKTENTSPLSIVRSTSTPRGHRAQRGPGPFCSPILSTYSAFPSAVLTLPRQPASILVGGTHSPGGDPAPKVPPKPPYVTTHHHNNDTSAKASSRVTPATLPRPQHSQELCVSFRERGEETTV